ncbi:HNH endonuclease [Promicromonospora sp. NPDC090134]|uniref:HNH endonuclease signature motif containing protein n=1 Tax=Promicromonospora sp. NPDC090134 TaxID=3364408 RepID=UPI0037FE361A
MDDGRKYRTMGRALLDDQTSSGPVVAEGLPAWTPDAVPVSAWPVDRLRAALTGAVGAELARVVAEATDPDAGLLSDLPDDALGDLVVACGRLQSWAAGLQARTVGERAGRETSPLAHSSLVAQVTGELVVTGTEASEVVVRGESGVDHPTVITALTAGQIDVRKAHTLLRSAAQLTPEERAEAIARYLPQAPFRTWRWLRSKLLAFAKSRHGSAETAQIAARRRNVQLDRAENDMGWLSAYLPAADATAVWNVIDDMAHQLQRTTGEDRDLGQLRADCLTGIVTGRLLPADRFAEAGEQTAPGALGSNGSAPGAHDCVCGGRAPVQVVRVTPTRPIVRVTVPATALLGLDDAPGELDGFGPVTADLAGRIAADATWQRLVTDPLTGVLTDCSTTSYRPGTVLRQAVVARDRTCAFPHCEHPADRDDLDHIVPFDHDLDRSVLPLDTPGQTRADNLQPLCRRHHLLKTHGGWGVVRDAGSGVTTWTSPSGRVHRRPPTVLDTHVELDDVDPTRATTSRCGP